MNPIPLDYQGPHKRKYTRGDRASLVMRITEPANGTSDATHTRGIVYAIVFIGLLVLVACAVHFVVDYARLMDTMSR